MKRKLFKCTADEEDQPLTIHSYIRMRKNELHKNLILSSLSLSAMYAMYKILMIMRDYEHDFLGIWSYVAFNAAKIFGFIVLPTFAISRFSSQKILRYGMFINSLLIFLHYVKSLEAIISAATIMGLVSGSIWVSQLTYVWRLSKIMSKVSGDDLQTVLLRFGGIFFSIYRAYEVACYMPVAFVPSASTYSNYSKDDCGTKFYFGDHTSLSEFALPPNNDRSFIASVTIIVLAFCALSLSTILIDPPHKLTATHLGLEKHDSGMSTIIRLFKRRRLQLMIPMGIFAGYEKMLKSYDYTTAYVGCAESASRAIYVNFLGCLGASQMSLSLAPLVELTSLQIMLFLAALTHLILISVLLLENEIDFIGYCVISAMWSLASSTWDCLLYVLYGMISPGEELEAFCHLGFWYSVGATANFILMRFVRVSIKMWVGLVCLIAATASVLILPYIINYVPKKIEPINVDPAGRTGSSVPAGQRVSDRPRKTGVYFGKTSLIRDHYPPEVKSISTSKIHHVAIPKTRARFDRHEDSNEDVRALF